MVAKTPEQAATAAKKSRNVDQIDCPPDGGAADQLSVTGCASRQPVGLEHCAIAKPIYVAIEDDFMDTAARQIFRIMSADARFGDITIKIENAKAEYANSLAEAKASLTA